MGVALIAGVINDLSAAFLFPQTYQQLLQQGIVDTFNSLGSSVPLALVLIYFLAGPIEETVKYLILRASIYNKTDFNQAADGVIYGITLALGFVLIENTGYFVEIYQTSTANEFIIITLVRAIETTLMHVTSTAIIGLHLGHAKFSPANKSRIALTGLLIAALYHGTFNAIVVALPEPYSLMTFPIIVATLLYLVSNLKKPENQMVWKLVYPQKSTIQN